MKIKFNYLHNTRVPQALKIREFIMEIIELENKQVKAIDYIFCTDEFLFNINKEFLDHDNLTDIITFDLSEDAAITGEIYISTDRVHENAATFKTTFKRELYRVIIHGVLHLLGYKDKTKSEIQMMRQKEEHYLLLFEKNFNVHL